jgi:hypothetical protein
MLAGKSATHFRCANSRARLAEEAAEWQFAASVRDAEFEDSPRAQKPEPGIAAGPAHASLDPVKFVKSGSRHRLDRWEVI